MPVSRFGTFHGYPAIFNHMSQVIAVDAPDEIAHYKTFIDEAEGNVLLTGLGLGYLLQQMIAKDDVLNILAVELEPEIVEYNLQFATSKLVIIQGDAYKPTPEMLEHGPWDYAYHSVWHDRNLSTHPEIQKMKAAWHPHVVHQYVDWEDVIEGWMLSQP